MKPQAIDYCYGSHFDEARYYRDCKQYTNDIVATIMSGLCIIAIVTGLFVAWYAHDKRNEARDTKIVENQLAVNAARGYALSQKEVKNEN